MESYPQGYNPCPPVMYNPCPPVSSEPQLRGGKDFFDIQVVNFNVTNGTQEPSKSINNYVGGRKAILIVNTADIDPALS